MQGQRRRALFFLNRASRSGAFAEGAATSKLEAAGLELRPMICQGPQEVSACISTQANDVDCVIVGGGDGTLNAAARGIVETGLPFGILPLGTANDFARSIGVPADLDTAIQTIIDGHTHRIDVGEVNGHPFFNVASIGLAADLAKQLTTHEKRRFGRLIYSVRAIRLLMEASPFHATLIDGDCRSMVRTMQITVGNGRYYGGGNVIASDARIDDGYLDLYSLEFSQVWRMALMIRSFKLGEHGSVREVRTARADRFEVVTRRPRPVNADGELVTHTPAIFTQRRLAATVYAPRDRPLGLGIG